jgi:hypothetical protein
LHGEGVVVGLPKSNDMDEWFVEPEDITTDNFGILPRSL